MKVDVETPTTILTQFGVTNCIPKVARGGTVARSVASPNGYTKRHGDRTSNPLPDDKMGSFCSLKAALVSTPDIIPPILPAPGTKPELWAGAALR